MLVLIADLLSLSLTLISLFPHHILPFIFQPSVFLSLIFWCSRFGFRLHTRTQTSPVNYVCRTANRKRLQGH